MGPCTPSTPSQASSSRAYSVQTIEPADIAYQRPYPLWPPDSMAPPSESPTAIDRQIRTLEDTRSAVMLVDRLSRLSFKYFGDGSGALDLVRSSTYEFDDDHPDVRKGKKAYDDDYEVLSKAVQTLLCNDKVDKHGRMILRDILSRAERWKESRQGPSLLSRASRALSKACRHEQLS
jgi:hypothetical protein